MQRPVTEEGVVRQILVAPEQRHAVRPGSDVVQSRIAFAGRTIFFAVRRYGPRYGGGRHGLPDEPYREVLEA